MTVDRVSTAAATSAEQDRAREQAEELAGCCSPDEQAACCAPAEKASCCGAAAAGTCGCRAGSAVGA